MSPVPATLVDLHGLPAPGSPDEAAAITERLLGMQLEAEKLTVDTYLAAFEKNGGIVEERITGVALTSPERPDAGAAGRHRRTAVHP